MRIALCAALLLVLAHALAAPPIRAEPLSVETRLTVIEQKVDAMLGRLGQVEATAATMPEVRTAIAALQRGEGAVPIPVRRVTAEEAVIFAVFATALDALAGGTQPAPPHTLLSTDQVRTYDKLLADLKGGAFNGRWDNFDADLGAVMAKVAEEYNSNVKYYKDKAKDTTVEWLHGEKPATFYGNLRTGSISGMANGMLALAKYYKMETSIR